MLIENKIGSLSTMPIDDKSIDWLMLEWYETRKKIIRKKTSSGRELSLKLLNANTELNEGDVLLEEAGILTVVSIIPCDCIVIKPDSLLQTASLCYEIGNRHLPLLYQSQSEIYQKGKLVIKENLLMQPAFISVHAIGQLEGYTHQASMICIDKKIDTKQAKQLLVHILTAETAIEFGVSTLSVNGLIIRLLGNGAEHLYDLLKKIPVLIHSNISL